MFDGLRAASDVGVSTIICSTSSRGRPVRSWTRSISAWPCSIPAPSSQGRPSARSCGAMVRILKVPPPSGARSGSTTVEQTMSIHGSRAYVSPRVEGLELGVQAGRRADAAGGRRRPGRACVGKVMSRPRPAWTANSDEPRLPGVAASTQVGRGPRCRRASRPAVQVRRRHAPRGGPPIRPVGGRRADARPSTTCTRATGDGRRPAAVVDRGHQRVGQGAGAADRRGPAELAPPRRDRRRQDAGARAAEVLDGGERQPESTGRAPPECSNRRRAPRPTRSAPAGLVLLVARRREAARRSFQPGVRGGQAAVPLAHHRAQLVGVRREKRASSSAVASRSRCTVTRVPVGSGSTTAGSVWT